MTDELAAFPEPNLNPSAYPWARRVMARIADREREASRVSQQVAGLSRSVVSAVRLAGHSSFRWRGDWVGQTLSAPGVIVVSSAYGGRV